jgi:hypothetical protein
MLPISFGLPSASKPGPRLADEQGTLISKVDIMDFQELRAANASDYEKSTTEGKTIL